MNSRSARISIDRISDNEHAHQDRQTFSAHNDADRRQADCDRRQPVGLSIPSYSARRYLKLLKTFKQMPPTNCAVYIFDRMRREIWRVLDEQLENMIQNFNRK